MQYHLAIKRNRLLIETTWMNLRHYLERKRPVSKNKCILYIYMNTRTAKVIYREGSEKIVSFGEI